LAITAVEQLQPILFLYEEHPGVTWLDINIAKTIVLSIHSPAVLCKQLRGLEKATLDNVRNT
jgi:hypothetical protein